MFLNRRGFSATAVLAAGVHLIGCTYTHPGGSVLLNPQDGVVCGTRDQPEKASADISRYEEIVSTGRLRISCTVPREEQLHFDEARYQRMELVTHYSAGEVLKFVGLMALGNILILPIFLYVDIFLVMTVSATHEPPMTGSTERRPLPEVFVMRDATEWRQLAAIPMPGQPCRAEVASESSSGLRLIREFSGVTGENGEWSADMRELIPLLRADDDVILLKMQVSMPGPSIYDQKIYLTVREIREMATK